MSIELQFILFRYYGGQDEHQQEAVLRHEVEGRGGEVGFSYNTPDILNPRHLRCFFRYPLRLGMC